MSFRTLSISTFISLGAIASAHPNHEDPTMLDPVVVYGRSLDISQTASSASTGKVGSAELDARPFLRRGELLEVVPGVVVTQHSGSGKANQYFVRGFNLDHGTDFAVSVDGMPVNMRTHGHGQGYADMNFIIPELISSVAYEKGPYQAHNGDFSSAGAARFNLRDTVKRPFAKVEIGEDNEYRAVAANTLRHASGATTTAAGEFSYKDGPWENPEHSRRFNGMVRHAWGSAENQYALTALGYHGGWDSTDQIPLRAIDSGLIGRFGAIDPTDGGESDRASLSFDWAHDAGNAVTALNLYAIYYRMDLYSNFTYFMDDPANGDQFHQHDERGVFGGSLTRKWDSELGGMKTETAIGAQLRDDVIDIALERSAARDTLSTVRADQVHEASLGLFAESTLHVADWFRIQPGIRADAYYFDVDSGLAANSGTADDAILGPKMNLIFGPWKKTELYVNAGYGFHSNDARGTTITVDPANGVTPADKVDPLAATKGAEIGVRTSIIDGLVSTVSFWALEVDSELVFVGDAGGTEANGRTWRHGVELANFYQVNEWLAFDADLALTHARYAEDAGGGRYIPGSLDTVATGGAIVKFGGGWSAALRARYFGPQPLTEDNSVEGDSSLTFNARLGWRGRDWEVALSVLNLLDRDNNDIVYYYESQLPGEAAPVADYHLHPAEPRAFRLTATRWF